MICPSRVRITVTPGPAKTRPEPEMPWPPFLRSHAVRIVVTYARSGASRLGHSDRRGTRVENGARGDCRAAPYRHLASTRRSGFGRGRYDGDHRGRSNRP